MSLLQKLKDIPKKGLLAASLALPFSGCWEGKWESLQSELRPSGRVIPRIRDVSSFEKIARDYSIDSHSIESPNLLVSVKESEKSSKFQVKEENQFVENYTFDRMRRKTNDGLKIVCTVIAGAIIGAGVVHEEDAGIGFVSGGTLAFGLGVLIYTDSQMQFKEFEEKTFKSDSPIEIENPQAKRTFEELVEEKTTKLLIPARFAKMALASGSLVFPAKPYETDEDGIFRFNPFENNPDMAFSSKTLEARLSSDPLVQEILPPQRASLLQKMLSRISPKKTSLVVSTNESSTKPNLTIKNDQKPITLEAYFAPRSIIYDVVKEFVDAEINSKIGRVLFTIKDLGSHVEIEGANISLTPNAPPKSQLAAPYFSGSLRDYVAENFITDYPVQRIVRKSVSSTETFVLYTGANPILEITHPKYNFVQGEADIRKSREKTVYMKDRGSKVRVEDAGSQDGGIE